MGSRPPSNTAARQPLTTLPLNIYFIINVLSPVLAVYGMINEPLETTVREQNAQMRRMVPRSLKSFRVRVFQTFTYGI